MASPLPPVVSSNEWEEARSALLTKEKALTRQLDALAAERRRLPMRELPKPANSYMFEGPDGPRSLLDLFGGKTQLVIYRFMDNGPGRLCPGCSHLTNNWPRSPLAELKERDGVSIVHISDMPLAQIQAACKDHEWTMPFYSSRGNGFAADIGAGDWAFMLSCFIRDGVNVYQTYSTTSRGVDRLVWQNNLLDLTVYGRQQAWEDSPEGWPQRPTYERLERA